MRCYYTSNGIAKNKNKDKLTTLIACRDSKHLKHTLLIDLENGTVIVEKSSHNAKHGLPFVPATALLRIHPVK